MPEVLFFIIGSRPSPQIEKLNGRDNITVTGFVDDIRPYHEAATVVVVPLRQARGVQNKILEALSMGKPVVTTSNALEGIEAHNGREVLVSDEDQAFAQSVIDLLRQPEKRTKLGTEGRQFVVRNFEWDKNMAELVTLIEDSR